LRPQGRLPDSCLPKTLDGRRALHDGDGPRRAGRRRAAIAAGPTRGAPGVPHNRRNAGRRRRRRHRRSDRRRHARGRPPLAAAPRRSAAGGVRPWREIGRRRCRRGCRRGRSRAPARRLPGARAHPPPDGRWSPPPPQASLHRRCHIRPPRRSAVVAGAGARGSPRPPRLGHGTAADVNVGHWAVVAADGEGTCRLLSPPRVFPPAPTHRARRVVAVASAGRPAGGGARAPPPSRRPSALRVPAQTDIGHPPPPSRNTHRAGVPVCAVIS